MVHLSETSKVNTHTQPFAYQWDTLVRKHYNKYQSLIDAHTYQLQRTQRLPFVIFLLFSPWNTPGSTTLSLLFLTSSKRNKPLEKSLRMNSICTKISTHASHAILTELSITIFQSPKSEVWLVLACSHMLRSSTSQSLPEPCSSSLQSSLISSEKYQLIVWPKPNQVNF